MHSSRMRTICLLPVAPSMYCLGGVPGPGGCTWSGGYLVPEGVPGPGGVPAQILPLWTETLTHATQNITLPQISFAGAKNAYGDPPYRMVSRGYSVPRHAIWRLCE